MKIQIGHFYFIKNEFLEKINDNGLMKNKKNGIKRPCYYCFKSKENGNIIWLIPISTKVDKYQKVYDTKLERQIQLGKSPSVDTIVFGNVANTFSAFLIQNMFPVTEKYIEDVYVKNNIRIRVSHKLQIEIIEKAEKVLNLYNHGMKNILFPNVDEILKILKNELS